ILSAMAGLLPALSEKTSEGPNIDADPWETHQTHWQTFLLHVAALFVITVFIEFLVYAGLNRLSMKRITMHRLVRGTVASNLFSYVVLVGTVWLLPPRSDDFQFRPNSDWVKENPRRVWFVDQDSKQLCSIRLDGTDRRTEIANELCRIGWYLEQHSIYAVVPDYNMVLYVGEDEHWHCVHEGHDRALSASVAEAWPMRCHIWPTLQDALSEVGITVGDDESAAPTVFFAATDRPWVTHAESSTYDVLTPLMWTVGVGSSRIQVKNNNSGDILTFGVKAGISVLPCRAPAITDNEDLILFRCGGWLMILDPARRTVGRLVRGDSLMLETPAFTKRDNW
ncbi:MAG: hypothetical protein JSV19_10890, partial [Phycisphaerales bacterium]